MNDDICLFFLLLFDTSKSRHQGHTAVWQIVLHVIKKEFSAGKKVLVNILESVLHTHYSTNENGGKVKNMTRP